jgi:membrane protease YdiL (CAAX protease family)
VFVLLFPVTMSWIYLIVLGATEHPSGEEQVGMSVAFATAKAIQFSFPVIYVWYFERHRLRFAWPTLRGLEYGAGFGLAVALLIFVTFFGWFQHTELFAQTPEKVYQLVNKLHANTPARYVLLTLIFCVGHSLLEEFYWRWFAFGWLRRYVPLGAAIVISALGFTAHHLLLLHVYFPGNFWLLAVPLALAVAVGGAVWAWIYDRSGSLYAAWISHMLIDLAIFAAGYAMIAPLMGE